ncbi:MAG TPA: FAD-dependent oxidoreductase [Solirubrobacteraceae bacterium]|nr:FAD-dependent oxidoreductase [Solirubrobacteraceae bacterium]
MRIAVIGAGVAGLACASELAGAGHEVVVFEKARGPGGRTSSRRTDRGAFDHGCPVLARGSWLLELAPLGVELADFAHGEVPVPRMSALCRALAEGLDVRAGVRVAPVVREGGAFRLVDDHGRALGTFDRVAVAAPAPQAAELLAHAAPGVAARAREVDYEPCWAALAAWDDPLPITPDWHRDDAPGAAVRWAARESAKPGRDAGERWTIQGAAAWSRERLEDDADDVARDLVAALGAAAGASPLPAPTLLTAHRWRYARVVTALQDACLTEAGAGAAGDWCAPPPGPRDPAALQAAAGVPDALHAGRALALALAA